LILEKRCGSSLGVSELRELAKVVLVRHTFSQLVKNFVERE